MACLMAGSILNAKKMQNPKYHLKSLLSLTTGLHLLLALVMLPHYDLWHSFDLNHYFQIAQQLRSGAVPYRDFLLEYPPLAIVPLLLPTLGGVPETVTGYAWRFVLTNLGWFALGGWLIRLIAQRSKLVPDRAIAHYCLLSLAIAPLLLWRYDLFPMVLSLGAIVCLNAPLWAGIFLGLGIAAKLYPVIFIPVFVAYYLALAKTARYEAGHEISNETINPNDQNSTNPSPLSHPNCLAPRWGREANFWRKPGRWLTQPLTQQIGKLCSVRSFNALLQLGGGITAALLATCVPFWQLAPTQFTSFLTYHQARGFQVESTWAGAIALLHRLGWVEARTEMNYGAQHLISPLADQLRAWQPPTSAIVMFSLWVGIIIYMHSPQHTTVPPQTIAPCPSDFPPSQIRSQIYVALAIVLCAFLLINKVFSPQYLIWLLGILPLALQPLQGASSPVYSPISPSVPQHTSDPVPSPIEQVAPLHAVPSPVQASVPNSITPSAIPTRTTPQLIATSPAPINIWGQAWGQSLQRHSFKLTLCIYLCTTIISFVTRQLRLFYLPSVLLLNLRHLLLLGICLCAISWLWQIRDRSD